MRSPAELDKSDVVLLRENKERGWVSQIHLLSICMLRSISFYWIVDILGYADQTIINTEIPLVLSTLLQKFNESLNMKSCTSINTELSTIREIYCLVGTISSEVGTIVVSKRVF